MVCPSVCHAKRLPNRKCKQVRKFISGITKKIIIKLAVFVTVPNRSQEDFFAISVQGFPNYRMARAFGGEFNLADWRILERSAKLNSANIFA